VIKESVVIKDSVVIKEFVVIMRKRRDNPAWRRS
jgi:hypothetical protein